MHILCIIYFVPCNRSLIIILRYLHPPIECVLGRTGSVRMLGTVSIAMSWTKSKKTKPEFIGLQNFQWSWTWRFSQNDVPNRYLSVDVNLHQLDTSVRHFRGCVVVPEWYAWVCKSRENEPRGLYQRYEKADRIVWWWWSVSAGRIPTGTCLPSSSWGSFRSIAWKLIFNRYKPSTKYNSQKTINPISF